ncbi:Uncharacterised protein [uncultured archaeon]|nr:Uncharacterised protein [uncultured archaeon]
MYTLENRINGILIGFTYVQNEKEVGNGNYSYSVQHYRINKTPSVIKFKIIHKRDEGAEKLSLLIYKEIEKIIKERGK